MLLVDALGLEQPSQLGVSLLEAAHCHAPDVSRKTYSNKILSALTCRVIRFEISAAWRLAKLQHLIQRPNGQTE